MDDSAALVPVLIHRSQFPDRVRAALRESFANRRIDHRFHYDTPLRAHRWLRVHRAWSPSRTDPAGQAIYDDAFARVANEMAGSTSTVIGLGCGGGQKDARLLRRLAENGRPPRYVALDVSGPLVLIAREAAVPVVGPSGVTPVVADLLGATDLPEALEAHLAADGSRVLTFFGMIPNFEPRAILARLGAWVRPGDRLLFSANLVPEENLEAGMRRILPQYDNAETRQWLSTVLEDHGLPPESGRLEFAAEFIAGRPELRRFSAWWRVENASRAVVDEAEFGFQPGDRLRVFFSYRYTSATLRGLLNEHGLEVDQEWTASSAGEGVFLCRRAEGPSD
ncbi:MAG: L-histidine N(alpha)-methyltransferase [Limisphaerales bacterium]